MCSQLAFVRFHDLLPIRDVFDVHAPRREVFDARELRLLAVDRRRSERALATSLARPTQGMKLMAIGLCVFTGVTSPYSHGTSSFSSM